MMGIVYKAIDPDRTGRLRSRSSTSRSRFPIQSGSVREALPGRGADRVAPLASGIVEVYEVGRDEPTGTPFLALEFLVGHTLEERLQAADAPDWKEGLRIVARVATALHYAHGQGVVHRDIKPRTSWSWRTASRRSWTSAWRGWRSGSAHDHGQLVGTPLYMSPSRRSGARWMAGAICSRSAA